MPITTLVARAFSLASSIFATKTIIAFFAIMKLEGFDHIQFDLVIDPCPVVVFGYIDTDNYHIAMDQ
ncbi:hypothetical protein MTHERMOG20_10140 [Moorella thermoacetica]|nr:hypothetical protein MTHERMOG20_10140 [Moorella thermoacetica]